MYDIAPWPEEAHASATVWSVGQQFESGRMEQVCGHIFTESGNCAPEGHTTCVPSGIAWSVEGMLRSCYIHTHTLTINICKPTWDLTSSTAAGGLCQLLTESFCKQLTETSGSKRPALTSPVRKAAVLLVKSHVDSRNAAMSLYQINIRTHTHTHTHVHTA